MENGTQMSKFDWKKEQERVNFMENGTRNTNISGKWGENERI